MTGFRPFQPFASVPLGVAAVTIYQHNFGGSSGASLAGVTVDSSSGTYGGSAAPAWTSVGSGAYIKADGSFISDPGAYDGMRLPFVPVAGVVYRLYCQISLTSTTGADWAAYGFLGSAGNDLYTSGWAWGVLASSGPSNITWFSSALNDQVSYADAGLGISPPRVAGLMVELDTRPTSPAFWTYKLYFNGVFLHSFTYAANPVINYLSLGHFGTATGAFSAFQLDVIP